MKKNEALYQLIHSLSPNEKRFFKIYASRHTIGEENNYVKLFSLFDSIKTYNEQEINDLSESADFVRYFAAEKNYLYNLILDCLDIYHKETSTDRQISKMINTGRVLLEKKLDEQAAKLLLKAQKLAQEHCRYENLLSINYLLIRKDFAKETITSESLKAFHHSSRAVVDNLYTKQIYQFAFQRLMLLRRQIGVITDVNEQNRLIDTYPHLNEPLNDAPLTFDSKVYYLLSQLEFHRICRKRYLGRTIALELIDLFEHNQTKITGEFIERYTYTLYNFMVMRLYNNTSEVEHILDKLYNLDKYVPSKITKQEHARCFEFHYTALTDIYLETKQYEKVWDLLPDFNRAMAEYQPHLTPSFIIALHFNFTCLFFGLGEFREALKWSNKVRNADNTFRNDLFYNLRTLNMIIHLELGNLEILPSLIKSAAYHHKKGAPNTALQKSIMQCMKQVLKSSSKKDRQRIFSKLKGELVMIQENPEENHIFHDADLVAWADKKAVSG